MDEDDDLQRVLANTPWSAILIPLAVALIVFIVLIVITLRGSRV